jgi:hypothetical protein
MRIFWPKSGANWATPALEPRRRSEELKPALKCFARRLRRAERCTFERRAMHQAGVHAKTGQAARLCPVFSSGEGRIMFCRAVTSSGLQPVHSHRCDAPSDGLPNVGHGGVDDPSDRGPRRSGRRPSDGSRRSKRARGLEPGRAFQRWERAVLRGPRPAQKRRQAAEWQQAAELEEISSRSLIPPM